MEAGDAVEQRVAELAIIEETGREIAQAQLDVACPVEIRPRISPSGVIT